METKSERSNCHGLDMYRGGKVNITQKDAEVRSARQEA